MPSMTYLVHRTPGDFAITGDGSSPRWQHSTVLSAFSYPWEAQTPPRTTFRAIHGDHWLYFLFDVDDSDIHVEVGSNQKQDVIDSSRVEVFFCIDENLKPYYCLELDAAGRILDYQGRFHREFDFGWSWPKDDLVVRASLRQQGYIVEAAVSKQSLLTLGLLPNGGNTLQAGLYRAQSTQTVSPREHMRWISWIKPDTATPDFHIASSFGRLLLGD